MSRDNLYFKAVIVCFIYFYFMVMGGIAKASCLGDCDQDGQVGDIEVDSAINQFLGIEDIQSCCDEYEDGAVGITELQYIINRHLNGCGAKDRYEDDDTPENSKMLIEFLEKDNNLLKIPHYEPFQTHNFSSTDDVDWIQLYAYQQDSETYFIDVYNVGADCNPVIELYDQNLNFIDKANDNGKGMGETLIFYQSYRNYDGVYYVKIYHNKSTLYKEAGKNYYKVQFRKGEAPDLPGWVYGKVTPAVNGVVKTDLFGQGLILYGGWYFIPRPAGEYYLWVEASGYTYSAFINIGSAQYLRHDIWLQPIR